MIIDSVGFYKCRDGSKAKVDYIGKEFVIGQKHMSDGRQYENFWNASSGRCVMSGVSEHNIISKWQDPEIPLDFDWDAFVSMQKVTVWFNAGDERWHFQSDYMKGRIRTKYNPKPPFPPRLQGWTNI